MSADNRTAVPTSSDTTPAGSVSERLDTRQEDPVPYLTRLLLATSTLEDFLTDLAKFAVTSFAPAMSCGITLQQADRPLTVCSSDALALAVDELQYERDVGPCLQALRTGDVVIVTDNSTETRWGDFPAHAQAHGVLSSMSLPLTAAGVVVGAMNLYSDQADVFADRDHVTYGQSLVAQADAVLGIAMRLGSHAALTEQLRQAMANRSVIDQAVGILMAQQRCTATVAFDVLRRASSHRNRKLRDVAADIVASTSGAAATPSPFHERRATTGP